MVGLFAKEWAQDCNLARFAVDRSDWTTLDNISQMYNIIYDKMVDAGVGEKLDTSVFMNQKGEIVEEFYRLGRKVDTQLTQRPDSLPAKPDATV